MAKRYKTCGSRKGTLRCQLTAGHTMEHSYPNTRGMNKVPRKQKKQENKIIDWW